MRIRTPMKFGPEGACADEDVVIRRQIEVQKSQNDAEYAALPQATDEGLSFL
jgi:hypothetical protein